MGSSRTSICGQRTLSLRRSASGAKPQSSPTSRSVGIRHADLCASYFNPKAWTMGENRGDFRTTRHAVTSSGFPSQSRIAP